MTGRPTAAPNGSEDTWLAAVSRVMARVTAGAEGPGVLQALAQGTLDEFDAVLVRIWLHDPADGHLHLTAIAGLTGDPLTLGGPVALSSPSTLARVFVNRTPSHTDTVTREVFPHNFVWARAHGIQASATYPLLVGDRAIGAMSFGFRRAWQPLLRQALEVLVRQGALALDHVRAIEESRAAQQAAGRQVMRLTAMTEITGQLLSATELETVLRVVVEAAVRLCDVPAALITLVDDDLQRVRVVAEHGPYPPQLREAVHRGAGLSEAFLTTTPSGRALTTGQTVVLSDYAEAPPSPARDVTVAAGFRAIVAAPLCVGGRAISALVLHDYEPRDFAGDDVALARALADQAALAIEHARLLQRSRDAAVLEERARLARELHDSVSQALYGIALGTSAMQELLAPPPGKTRELLSFVQNLADNSLAEMRALLFDLRPDTFGQEGLVGALEKEAAALRSRYDLEVATRFDTEPSLPIEAKHSLYRIALEAVHNIVKHAGARHVALRLELDKDRGEVVLTVEDDGAGFDRAATAAGHLGQHSMRERAAGLGGVLEVTSAPGAGTTVRVRVPLPKLAGAAPVT